MKNIEHLLSLFCLFVVFVVQPVLAEDKHKQLLTEFNFVAAELLVHSSNNLAATQFD